MSPSRIDAEDDLNVIIPAVSASDLPDACSPDLILVPGNLAEYQQTWHLNGSEWKGALNMQQYLEREHFLLQQDLTNDSQATSWILTSSKYPLKSDGTRHILASCETLLKSGYVVRDGVMKRIRTHGIGSVYTRPEHRGRGYAGRMMTELGQKLESWQQESDQIGNFSVLYSDIGQKFYNKFGWEPFPSTHINLEPLGSKEYEATKAKFPPVEDLKVKDLQNIPAARYLEEALKMVSIHEPEVPIVAIKPDMQHFRWHHAREEFQAPLLGMQFPHVKGAIHKDSGVAIIWSRVFATEKKEWSLNLLHIVLPTHLRVEPTLEARQALSALLLRAQHEAHVWNMEAGVEVWDPSMFVTAAAQDLRTAEQGNVEVIVRDTNHVCSLKWIGAMPDDDPERKVAWLYNEKYAWC